MPDKSKDAEQLAEIVPETSTQTVSAPEDDTSTQEKPEPVELPDSSKDAEQPTEVVPEAPTQTVSASEDDTSAQEKVTPVKMPEEDPICASTVAEYVSQIAAMKEGLAMDKVIIQEMADSLVKIDPNM